MLGRFGQTIESLYDPSPSQGMLRFLWWLRGPNHRDSSFGVQRDGGEILEADKGVILALRYTRGFLFSHQEFDLSREGTR